GGGGGEARAARGGAGRGGGGGPGGREESWGAGVRAGLRRLLAWLLGRGVAGLTRVAGRRAPGPLDPTRVRRILVVRLDLLGDLVLSMPAVQALRAAYPEARIDLLTSPYAAPVAPLFPAIDEVIALDVHQ